MRTFLDESSIKMKNKKNKKWLKKLMQNMILSEEILGKNLASKERFLSKREQKMKYL